jgi:hypothetical protein
MPRSAERTKSPSNRNGHRPSRAKFFNEFSFAEVQQVFKETVEGFKNKWLFDITDKSEVMKQCRKMTDDDPHPYLQWLIRQRLAFYNSGFKLESEVGKKDTQGWLDKHANYPFGKLARDVFREYQVTSNVVAFWRSEAADNRRTRVDRKSDAGFIEGLPRVTIFNCEDVRYSNDFGVEQLWITPKRRKLSDDEKAALGPRYAAAIEEGKELKLDPKYGERFKVLTTAKMGNGFGMPDLKAIMGDLAILELLKLGDWNGAWARRKILRQTKKGHEITGGDRQGSPDYYFNPAYGKKLKKALNDQNGFMELIGNFDQDLAYVFLEAAFFDPKLYEAVEMRLDRYVGAMAMMMREGKLQSPFLMSLFRVEGLAERDLVGGYLASIFNDEFFYGSGDAPPQRILPTWDEGVFFNEKMLIAWMGFGLQNGIISPITMRRWMRVSDRGETELMKLAHTNGKDYEPVFEQKQGLLDAPEGGAPARTEKGGGGGGAE